MLAKRGVILIHHKRVVPVCGHMVQIVVNGLVGSLILGFRASLAGIQAKHATGGRDRRCVLAHLAAQVLVRKRRDAHLGVEACADVLDIDQPAANDNDGDNPNDQQDNLAVIVDIENRRQHKEQDLTSTTAAKPPLM